MKNEEGQVIGCEEDDDSDDGGKDVHINNLTCWVIS